MPAEHSGQMTQEAQRAGFGLRAGFPTQAFVVFLHADVGPDKGQGTERADREAVAYAYFEIAVEYIELAEWPRAVKFFNQALEIFKELGDRTNEAFTLANIGRAYIGLGDPQGALECYTKALPIFKEVGNRDGEAKALANIGIAYLENEPQQAVKFCKQALKLFRALGDGGNEASALANIGYGYRILGKPQQALKFLNDALPIFREIGDQACKALVLINIGIVYNGLGDPQGALESFNQALEIFEEVGNQEGVAFMLKQIEQIKALDAPPPVALLSDAPPEPGREPESMPPSPKRAKGELTVRPCQKNREGTQLVAAHLKKPLASAFKKAARKQNMTTQEALEKLVTRFVKDTASPAARKKLLKTTIKNQKAALQAALKTALDLV